MRYIGNIITNSSIEISKFFNVVSDLKNIDISIPTLIIGWDNVKKLYPEQNILNNKINENISWTFSKREKRYQYEKDLKNFIESVVKEINDKINYHFFNYLLASETRRKNFIDYIKNGESSIYYNSRFLYAYNANDSITIGVSLKDLFYIGINPKFLIDIFNENNIIICNNIKDIGDDSFFLVKDNIKIVAYLNYLKNKDIYKEKENDKKYK